MNTQPAAANTTIVSVSPDPPDAPVCPPTAALALWLALQLAAILVPVLRVPLAAQHPEPAERLAAYWVAGTQVVVAGLLFPFLFGDWRRATVVVVSSWPFLLAGGYLAGMSAKDLAEPAGFVTAWLVTLALWAPLLRGRRAQMIGVAVASLLTLGGAMLRYLRLEFDAGRTDAGFDPASASPLLSTFNLLDGEAAAGGWILLGVVALVAVGVRGAKGLRGS